MSNLRFRTSKHQELVIEGKTKWCLEEGLNGVVAFTVNG